MTNESIGKPDKLGPSSAVAPPDRAGALSWLLRHWSEHLGLVVPASIAFLVAERLYAVGGWDLATGQAVLREAGAANVLLGTMVSLIAATAYLGLAYVLSVAAYRIARGLGFGRLPPESGGYLVIVSVGLLGLLAPAVFLIVMAGVLVWIVVCGIRDRSTGATRRYSGTSLIVYLINVVVLVFLVSGAPWMPREIVTVRDAQPLVGYVLDDDDMTAVLLHKPREVTYVPKATITSRQICNAQSERSWPWKPLPLTTDWGLFGPAHDGRADYPACPK